LALLDDGATYSNEGRIKLVNYSKAKRDQDLVTFKAHDSGIGALKLSPDGSLVATASVKGTLIRIFETHTGKQVNEVRRGAEKAKICDIIIDPENQYLSCSSDTGTVHIFSIASKEVENKKSVFSSLGGSYFSSQWSFGQFKVNDPRCKIALLPM